MSEEIAGRIELENGRRTCAALTGRWLQLQTLFVVIERRRAAQTKLWILAERKRTLNRPLMINTFDFSFLE